MSMPRKLMIFLLATICVAGIALLSLVRYLETAAVFFPGKDAVITPSHAGLPFEDLTIHTSDGCDLHAWFVKNPQAKSTVIFAHGNAGSMSDRLMKIKFFFDLGLNVLAFDYRGYGRSTGHPTENGIYTDAQAIYDYLKTRPDVDMSGVILYGSSLGGVVMVDLATKRPAALLIVDSSITNARDVAGIFYPYLPSFLMRIKFDSITKVKGLSVPKLFIHSPDDRTVPYEMGRRLYEAALGPKDFIISSGGHNEVQIVSDHKTANELRQYLTLRGLI